MDEREPHMVPNAVTKPQRSCRDLACSLHLARVLGQIVLVDAMGALVVQELQNQEAVMNAFFEETLQCFQL